MDHTTCPECIQHVPYPERVHVTIRVALATPHRTSPKRDAETTRVYHERCLPDVVGLHRLLKVAQDQPTDPNHSFED